MRIAYLSVFPPYRGGIAQFAASLLASLAEKHEVKAFNFKRQYPDFLFPGKTQYIESEEAYAYLSERVLDMLNPISYWNTAQQIIKFAPDVVYINYWMPFFSPALGSIAYLLKRKGIKVIAILHNLIPHEKRKGDALFNDYFIRQINGFLVMGSSVKQDLLSLKPKANYRQHPHPLYDHFGEKMDRTAALATFGIAPEKKVLLFFGLIRAYKGLDILIEAFGELSEEYELIIAGESYEEFTQYQNIINQHNNSDKVHPHIRYVADEEVPTFFSAADLCVLPYKSATQSGVVSIAFHFDLPVLVTDVGSLREIVDNFQGGEVVKPNDSKALAQAIRAFFTSDRNYSEQIKARKTTFSWEGLADTVVELAADED